MKVLMIEDNNADVAGIVDYCSEQGWEQETKRFDEGLKYIEEYDLRRPYTNFQKHLCEFHGLDLTLNKHIVLIQKDFRHLLNNNT